MGPKQTISTDQAQMGLKTLPDIHFLTSPKSEEEDETNKSHRDKTYFGYSYRFWCIVALCISVLVSGILDVIFHHVAGTTVHTTLRAFFYGYVIYSSGSTIKSCLCFSLFWTLGGLWWTGTSVWLFWSFHDMIQRYVILVIDMCVVAGLVAHSAIRERCQSGLARSLPKFRYRRNQDDCLTLEREPMPTARLHVFSERMGIGENCKLEFQQTESNSSSHRHGLPNHRLNKEQLTQQWVTHHQRSSTTSPVTLHCPSSRQADDNSDPDLAGVDVYTTTNQSSFPWESVSSSHEENQSTDRLSSEENEQPVSGSVELHSTKPSATPNVSSVVQTT